ncbi:MAG: hypothetical protein JO071_13925 [Deltaproteobacteria bacterium]|nr:hypothetical protein [Deltaproteobacteria bacterium]
MLMLTLGGGRTFDNKRASNLASMGAGINPNRIVWEILTFVVSLLFIALAWILPNSAANLVRTHLGGGGDAGAANTVASTVIETSKGAAQTAAGGMVASAHGSKELGAYVQRKLLS